MLGSTKPRHDITVCVCVCHTLPHSTQTEAHPLLFADNRTKSSKIRGENYNIRRLYCTDHFKDIKKQYCSSKHNGNRDEAILTPAVRRVIAVDIVQLTILCACVCTCMCECLPAQQCPRVRTACGVNRQTVQRRRVAPLKRLFRCRRFCGHSMAAAAVAWAVEAGTAPAQMPSVLICLRHCRRRCDTFRPIITVAAIAAHASRTTIRIVSIFCCCCCLDFYSIHGNV